MDKTTTNKIYRVFAIYFGIGIALLLLNHFIFRVEILTHLFSFPLGFLPPIHAVELRRRGKLSFTDTDYLKMTLFSILFTLLIFTAFYFLF